MTLETLETVLGVAVIVLGLFAPYLFVEYVNWDCKRQNRERDAELDK